MIKKIRKCSLFLFVFSTIFSLLSLGYSIHLYGGFNDMEVPLNFTYHIAKCNEQKIKYDDSGVELLNIKKENNIFLLSSVHIITFEDKYFCYTDKVKNYKFDFKKQILEKISTHKIYQDCSFFGYDFFYDGGLNAKNHNNNIMYMNSYINYVLEKGCLTD